MRTFIVNPFPDHFQVNIAYKTYIFMVINTAVIELLTKGALPLTNSDGEKAHIFGVTGLLDGDHQDFTRSWYAKAGASMTTIMLIEVFLTHIVTLFVVLIWWPCHRHRIRLQNRGKLGTAVMQSQLNEALGAPEWDVAGRFATVLNTLMITLLYCGGLPLLMPIAFVSFFVSYWMDKWLLCRYYAKPVALDSSIIRMGVNQLFLAVILHLAFTVWMFGSEGVLFSPSMDVRQRRSQESL